MNNDQQLLQELIAERKRIDDLIKHYESGGEPSEIKFSELMDPSLNSQYIDHSPNSTEIVRTVTTTNITFNNDYSMNLVQNHIHHTNTNVSLGDSAISAIDGILRNLFEY